MIRTTLGEVAAFTGGWVADADPALPVTAPAMPDSRAVQLGGLFVALPGEHADGHDFAAAAVAAGAAAVLAAHPVGVPAVVVPDVVAALGRLARSVVDRLPVATVTGVTGSSGKTSTKDLLAALLARLGPTVAAAGSWNNEIGLPLTVLRADESTCHLVLECSARGVGHIAYLCEIAPPRVGIVLNVGTAHVGLFGSRENIAAAKRELVEALPRDGLAVLNTDDPLVAGMRAGTSARVVTVGRGAGVDVRAGDVTLDERGRPAFTLETDTGRVPVRLGLSGEHHVDNALAAGAVAAALGLPLPAIAETLAAARPASRWRMEVRDRSDGLTVVNDAYNANPESMTAALRALVAIGTGRRTWAVLGEMAELGAAAAAAHEDVGRLAAQLAVSRVVGVGPLARHTVAAARGGAEWVAHAEAAVGLLANQVEPGDVVLVKASRAARLERVADALLREDTG